MNKVELNLDRRIKKTRRQLREALFALILEKGYDAVTVEEITRRADLGRTTFYLHYRDKEDLLLQCLEETADNLAEEIAKFHPVLQRPPSPVDPSDLMENNPIFLVFQHAAQNATIYRIILRGEGAYKIARRIREVASHYAAEYFSSRPVKDSEQSGSAIPLVVIANYFSESLLGMLTWWLENGMPYPPEKMTAMFRQILLDGLQKAVLSGNDMDTAVTRNGG